MSTSTIRVRFAPSPTGLMHLGNVRAALMNYLFARQKNGTFVLRIEDTDLARNFDHGAQQIMRDLEWLNLPFDEGPGKEGAYAPYFQSERAALYQEQLSVLVQKGYAYRCFCTQEDLEKKRNRQIALKQPPRYDRTCLKRAESETAQLLADNVPFIWRMKLSDQKTITITDLGHGTITFDMNHFSDFALTRQDGSVTFMFANCVDDIVMKITHVFRGEDHLSNTAGQVVLYQAFNAPLPVYWHLPIICNIDGKKLSKRDFGFSLNDLRDAGFLPEAMCNYLAIIGGRSYEQEIMSLSELAQTITFDNMHTAGQVKYDVEKLRWVNYKWINQYDPAQLAELVRPFLQKQFPAVARMDAQTLTGLIQAVKTDVHTLSEFCDALAFYFTAPTLNKADLETHVSAEQLTSIISLLKKHKDLLSDSNQFMTALKKDAKELGIPFKALFTTLRLALTGKPMGPGIDELIVMLGADTARARLGLLESL